MTNCSRHKKNVSVHIRWLIRRDMPKVLDIEHRVFEYPWTEDDFYIALRQRNAIGMVAEYCDTEIGYMIYNLYKTRLDLIAIAVDPLFHRQSVGRQLIDKLKSKMISQVTGMPRKRIVVKVRERNLQAQLFFSKMGFRAVSILPNYYEHTDESAYKFIFERNDDGT